MNRMRKFFALSGNDRALLLRALTTLWLVRVLLWTVPYPRVRAVIERLKKASLLQDRTPRPTADRIAWAVRAASTGVASGANCLLRALAGEVLLGRFGYQCELRFGANHDDPRGLAAHAWLECDGEIVLGELEAPAYTPFRASHAERT
ncbi:MAG: lasso peptide biosynthesis B2 protein [Candidatus Binataceae bacterium]